MCNTQRYSVRMCVFTHGTHTSVGAQVTATQRPDYSSKLSRALSPLSLAVRTLSVLLLNLVSPDGTSQRNRCRPQSMPGRWSPLQGGDYHPRCNTNNTCCTLTLGIIVLLTHMLGTSLMSRM